MIIKYATHLRVLTVIAVGSVAFIVIGPTGAFLVTTQVILYNVLKSGGRNV